MLSQLHAPRIPQPVEHRILTRGVPDAEIATTITAASIPVLRVFLRDILKSVSASSMGRRGRQGSSKTSAEAEAVPAPDPGRPRSRGAARARRVDDLDLALADDDEDGESERGIWPKTPDIVLTHEISVESARRSAVGRGGDDDDALHEMHAYAHNF